MSNPDKLKENQCKLTFTIVVLIFLFWALFGGPHKIQKYIEPLNEQTVLGVESAQGEKSILIQSIEKSDDFFTLFKAGKSFLESGKLELAIASLERVVELKPDFRDGHYLLGYTYLKSYEATGDYFVDNPSDIAEKTNLEKAELSLLRARKLDPKSAKILELIDKIKQAKK
ncbi:tetratricopeptide repeat protein [Candidatus Berkelbacteria bacterium]|nr:tetratricopeptide repeat protein [Candidatus Berkelbacteria bacterium]OIP05565.1 MAG: hypothetical protein AUK14_01500 [Candidatus Berkelbacteria bacterium CG2_30_39_44]